MRLFAFFAGLVLLGGLAAVITLPEASGTPYSAFRVVEGAGPARVGWVYHDDRKERFELVRGSRLWIYIRRPDLGQVFIIDGAAGTGEAVPIDEQRVDFSFWVGQLAVAPQGEATIDGETVTKFVTVDRHGDTRTYWLTDDGIPLRVESTFGVESSTTRLINLQRGPQPAHLFEVPDDIEIEAMKRHYD